MALAGGALMAWATLDIPFPVFLSQLHGAVSGWTFWLGVLKAPFFAGIIALTGCYEGLRVARSAESVGRQTTRSVVESIFLIIVADALFSILFSYLGV
jgi:phospholipid/cholesterol/gamma-HCH transport system permease protein